MEIWHPHFAQVGRTTAFTSIGKQDLDLLAHKLLIPGMSLLMGKIAEDIWLHVETPVPERRESEGWASESQMRFVDL